MAPGMVTQLIGLLVEMVRIIEFWVHGFNLSRAWPTWVVPSRCTSTTINPVTSGSLLHWIDLTAVCPGLHGNKLLALQVHALYVVQEPVYMLYSESDKSLFFKHPSCMSSIQYPGCGLHVEVILSEPASAISSDLANIPSQLIESWLRESVSHSYHYVPCSVNFPLSAFPQPACSPLYTQKNPVSKLSDYLLAVH